MSTDVKITSFGDKARDWWAAAKTNRLFVIGLGGAAALALLDQASKYWIVNIVALPAKEQIEILPFFNLTYVENRGMSFGLLAGGLVSRFFLSLVSTGVAIGLVIWLGQLRRPVAVAGAAFIIGGAVGNLYDRLAYGYVVDFLDFSGLMFPWVFNIADSAINIGIALLVLDAFQIRDTSEGVKK